jgi:hypothetical protein
MHEIVSACARQASVSDQVMALLDFHFHYGVGSIQKERDLVAQIGNLVADRLADRSPERKCVLQ